MFDKLKNLPLLGKVLIAIALGIGCSYFFPDFLNRSFVTLNGIFGNFLGFTIPLIIVGLVAPGIAELGKGAGKLLAVTAAIAYGSTLFAGFFSYFTCDFTYPVFLDPTNSFSAGIAHGEKILPYLIHCPVIFGSSRESIYIFFSNMFSSVSTNPFAL